MFTPPILVVVLAAAGLVIVLVVVLLPPFIHRRRSRDPRASPIDAEQQREALRSIAAADYAQFTRQRPTNGTQKELFTRRGTQAGPRSSSPPQGKTR